MEDVVENDEDKQWRRTKGDRTIFFGNRSPMINFKVEYRLPTVEIFTNFARAVLECITPIDILHIAAAFRQPWSSNEAASEEQVPSWAPALNLPRLFMPLMKATEFRAGLSSTRKIPVIKTVENTIFISGYQIVSVKLICTV
jgi:hypothetical protein